MPIARWQARSRSSRPLSDRPVAVACARHRSTMFMLSRPGCQGDQNESHARSKTGSAYIEQPQSKMPVIRPSSTRTLRLMRSAWASRVRSVDTRRRRRSTPPSPHPASARRPMTRRASGAIRGFADRARRSHRQEVIAPCRVGAWPDRSQPPNPRRHRGRCPPSHPARRRVTEQRPPIRPSSSSSSGSTLELSASGHPVSRRPARRSTTNMTGLLGN